jgi:putative transcriptional regulator
MLFLRRCSYFWCAFIGSYIAVRTPPLMQNSLRVARAAQRLTQEELARLIGVSRQTINAMEAGKYVPSTVLALKLARVFGQAVEQLFALEAGD